MSRPRWYAEGETRAERAALVAMEVLYWLVLAVALGTIAVWLVLATAAHLG